MAAEVVAKRLSFQDQGQPMQVQQQPIPAAAADVDPDADIPDAAQALEELRR